MSNYPSLSSVLSKHEFNKLNSLNNFVAARDLILRFGVNIFLIYSLFVLSTSSVIATLVIWCIYSTQFQFWGYAGLGHEAFHGRIFTSKKVNTALYIFCSALTWNNTSMFRKTHSLHHRETFSVDDTEAKSVQSWGVLDIFLYLFVDFKGMFRRIYYTLVNSLGYYPNFTRLDASHRLSAQTNLVVNVMIYSLVYVVTENLMMSFLLFIAPFSCSLVNRVLAKAQHHNLEKFSDEGALKYSRTLRLPSFLSFLYANMNYPAEHHFAPSIPYYRLPDFHNLLVEKGFIQSQSLMDFLHSTIKEIGVKQ